MRSVNNACILFIRLSKSLFTLHIKSVSEKPVVMFTSKRSVIFLVNNTIRDILFVSLYKLPPVVTNNYMFAMIIEYFQENVVILAYAVEFSPEKSHPFTAYHKNIKGTYIK